ncbi:hypothetical protein HN011_001641 [Eciton burchellii]|nr:hypothetical protein HN011_001641 [Eciton burchellii]
MSDENKWLMVYIHLCHESVHLHRSTHPRRSTLRLAKPDDLDGSRLCFILLVRSLLFNRSSVSFQTPTVSLAGEQEDRTAALPEGEDMIRGVPRESEAATFPCAHGQR